MTSAATIAASYIAGGLIPLSPYIVLSSASRGLLVSAMVTLMALGVFGYIKGRFTGRGRPECVTDHGDRRGGGRGSVWAGETDFVRRTQSGLTGSGLARAVLLAVLSFNFIGDALRDLLDPRSRIEAGLQSLSRRLRVAGIRTESCASLLVIVIPSEA